MRKVQLGAGYILDERNRMSRAESRCVRQWLYLRNYNQIQEEQTVQVSSAHSV